MAIELTTTTNPANIEAVTKSWLQIQAERGRAQELDVDLEDANACAPSTPKEQPLPATPMEGGFAVVRDQVVKPVPLHEQVCEQVGAAAQQLREPGDHHPDPREPVGLNGQHRLSGTPPAPMTPAQRD